MKIIVATLLLMLSFAPARAQVNAPQPAPSNPAQPVPPGKSISALTGTNFMTGTNFYFNTNRLSGATNATGLTTDRNAPPTVSDQSLSNIVPAMAERPAWATNVRAFWFTNYPAGINFPTNPVPPALTNITMQTDPDLWLSNWWWFSTNQSAARWNRSR